MKIKKKEKENKLPTVFIKDDQNILKLLDRNKETYVIESTSSTSIIRTQDCNYFCSDNNFPSKYLNFVSRVKKNGQLLAAAGVENTGITPQHIGYFKYYQSIEGTYYNISEIDVNGAYWELAYRMGYLTTRLYNEGKEAPKTVRLIALGSFATIRKIWDVSPEKGAILREIQINKDTRSYFFAVAKKLDEIMERVIDKIGSEHFYFYWVDAFFCNSYAKKHLLIEMEKEGLKCKTIDVPVMTIKRIDDHIKSYHLTTVEKYGKDKTDIRIKPFKMEYKKPTKAYLKNKFLEAINGGFDNE